MKKRFTIVIDEELLARAKRALGQPTMRATVEEALRRAAEQTEAESEVRRSADVHTGNRSLPPGLGSGGADRMPALPE